jgi:PAS domain S-box-containing protein
MKQSKLLQRQIKKLLPPELAAHPDMTRFLEAIQQSYQAYERDNELAARAFAISEEEYVEINRQLKQEVDIRQKSLAQLREMASTIAGNVQQNDTDDLLMVASYLNQQVGKRKNAEKVFTSLINNLQSGVLLENHERRIVFCNQLFLDMFGMTTVPENLLGVDCSNSADLSKGLFKDPDGFVQRIDQVLQSRKLVTADVLELADGRIFERDFIPIYVEGGYEGHLWNYTDITEKKKAADVLAKNELTNKLILNASLDAIIIIDGAGTITFWNPQAERVFGWSEQAVLGKTLAQTILPPPRAGLHLPQGQAGSGNKVVELEALDNKGRAFPVEVSVVPVKKEAETVFCTFIKDISERKKSENELKRLSLVASANQNAVLFVQPNGKISWCNERFYSLTGYGKAETLGKSPIELLRGQLTDAEDLREMLSYFQQGASFKKEAVCYRKDGTWFWGEASGQSVLDSDGHVLEYFAVLQDVTKEKQAQQKMAEFEQRFRLALEKIGDNVWEHDFTTGKTYFSNTSNKLLGQSGNDQHENASLWWGNTHPDDLTLLQMADQRYKDGSIDHHSMEYRIFTSNGSVRWVLDRGVVIEKSATGKPIKIVGSHTDITEMKLAEETLRINEEKYRNIIANINLGLMEVDNDDNIQYVNQGFCKMSGYSAAELIGQKATTLVVKDKYRETVNNKMQQRLKGISDAYEIEAIDKNGNSCWWLISAAPRYNDKGDIMGSIGIHLDITAQKKLELDLIEARELAEESARSKETFLANMSHEIRTPMNAILGLGKQLQKTDLNSEQHFLLDTIHKAGEHLMVILNDVLDISKIDAGALQLEQIGFTLQEVMMQTVQVMNHRAQEKGIQLLHSIQADIPPLLLGDPYRLKQVLLNLMSNAVKFTEKGSVQIACSVAGTNNGKTVVRIEVTDTGIGMDSHFIENIFHKFLQEDKSITRKYQGTGLGMSITKQLVELMQGHIDIQSQKNVGTTITLLIPFTAAKQSDLLPKETAVVDTGIIKGKKILLVEDNEMNRLVAITILNNYGAIIDQSENGAEALEALRSKAYDLVLMDMQMPVMDGLEATRLIRKQLNSQLPIIALTANAIKGESNKCIAAGMNDYLAKPFDEEALIKKMATWLNKEVPMNTPDSAAPLYNLVNLEAIASGDEDFLKSITQLFAEQTPPTVQAIKSAFATRDWNQVKSLAHSIKPSIDNFGIASLTAEIRQIEALALEKDPHHELPALIDHLEKVIDRVVQQLGQEV